MEKINGIRVGRKFYKVVKSDDPREDCSICDLHDKCGWNILAKDFCIETIGVGNIFRYSPELTDRLTKHSRVSEPEEGHITKIGKNERI